MQISEKLVGCCCSVGETIALAAPFTDIAPARTRKPMKTLITKTDFDAMYKSPSPQHLRIRRQLLLILILELNLLRLLRFAVKIDVMAND